MIVALYARVSKKVSTQDTENQLLQLRAYCSKFDWIIHKEYIDRKTGKNDDREQFKEMFEDARIRKFDLVFFWSLDRFSREGVLETLQYLQKLTSYKVEWKSYTEQYLDSLGVFKEAVLAILATIAKQERIRIVERINAGLDRTRARGTILGRRKVIVDSSKISNMLTVERLSIREVAKRLKVSRMTVVRRMREQDENF